MKGIEIPKSVNGEVGLSPALFGHVLELNGYFKIVFADGWPHHWSDLTTAAHERRVVLRRQSTKKQRADGAWAKDFEEQGIGFFKERLLTIHANNFLLLLILGGASICYCLA